MWPSLSQAHLLVGAIHRGESREKWLESLSPEGDLLVWIGSRSLLTPAEETLARLAEPVDAVEGQGLFRLRLSSLRHEVLRHRVKETREAHRL